MGLKDGGYIKGWPGVPIFYSNINLKGGRGKGYYRNANFRNFEIRDVQIPVYVTQCTYSSENTTVCELLTGKISDITWQTRTSKSTVAAVIAVLTFHAPACE